MQSGARQFDQILDEKLGHAESRTPTATGRNGYGRHHHPAVLFFSNAARPSHVDFGRIHGAYGPGFSSRATAAAPVAASRPSRILSDRQQQALTHLVSLGAALHADFTVRELKTAFKTLARLYHPDRHPGSCEFEKARLTRQFAMLHEAYRQLLNLVPLPPAA